MIKIDVLTLCPGCGRAADSKIFGVSTQLGPELVRCPKLRNRVQDGKKGMASLCGARQVALCATHGPVCGRLRSDGSIRLPDVLLHPPRVLRRGSRSLDYVECRTGCTLFQHPGWPDSVASCTYVPRKVAAPVQVAILATTWDLQLSVQNKFRAVFIVLRLLSLFVMWGRLIF